MDPKSGTFERSLNIREWAAPSCSTRCTHGGTSHACRADRLENQRLNKANPLMSATSNFTLGFAPASESKVESTDWLLSRQLLQRIATRIRLVSEAIGFSILGILIIANRYQADLRSCHWQWGCNPRRPQCSFSGHSFPRLRLCTLEVLRQTFSRAAGQASVGPFYFLEASASHGDSYVVCIRHQ